MALETIVRTLRDGALTISDASGTPKTITLPYTSGNLKYDCGGKDPQVFRSRGAFGSTPAVRNGDDQETTGEFEVYLTDLTDAAEGCITDILHNSGYFATTWVSTLGANAEVKTVKITFSVEGTNHGGSDGTIVFAHCYLIGGLSEGYPTVLRGKFRDFEAFPTVA
jgi:hypothetical protein